MPSFAVRSRASFVNALVLSGGGLLYLGQERLGKPKVL